MSPKMTIWSQFSIYLCECVCVFMLVFVCVCVLIVCILCVRNKKAIWEIKGHFIHQPRIRKKFIFSFDHTMRIKTLAKLTNSMLETLNLLTLYNKESLINVFQKRRLISLRPSDRMVWKLGHITRKITP